MVEFKAVISTKDGKSYSRVITGNYANSLIDKKIGDVVDGIFVGLPGYKLQITGGTDKDGFVMRPEVPGRRKIPLLVSEGRGFKPNHDGMRKRKIFRGNAISPETIQINFKITQYGGKPIEDLIKKTEKE